MCKPTGALPYHVYTSARFLFVSAVYRPFPDRPRGIRHHQTCFGVANSAGRSGVATDRSLVRLIFPSGFALYSWFSVQIFLLVGIIKLCPSRPNSVTTFRPCSIRFVCRVVSHSRIFERTVRINIHKLTEMQCFQGGGPHHVHAVDNSRYGHGG